MPYAAGGGSDISARLLAKDLEPILGKPVTVENRAGGGGWIGWGSLAASKPDGYTIGYINVPNIFAGYLDRSQGGARKENLESFTPLINHVTDHNMWSVKPDSKFKTVKDVIDEAKKRPGTITLNGGGHGTDDHVAALGIGANNGTSFQMVHFRGTPDGKMQVLGGNIEVYACNVSEAAEDVKSGVIRPLGVMSAERSKFIPNAPTFREQGFNEVWSTSRGIAAPAGSADGHRGGGDRCAGEDHQLAGAQGQGRGAGARSGDHQGRGLRQVPEGERAGDQEADELVAVGWGAAHIDRMRIALAAAVLAAAALASTTAMAQEWPLRPVRIVNPFPGAGATDTLARVLADHFATVFKQSFYVEARGGAGGQIALKAIADAPQDTYTLIISTVSLLAVQPNRQSKARLRPAPRHRQHRLRRRHPAGVLRQSIARRQNARGIRGARAQECKAAELFVVRRRHHGPSGRQYFAQKVNVKFEHVPYKGAAQGLTDFGTAVISCSRRRPCRRPPG